MSRYTVHVPKLAETRMQALERAVFVRDGWSWGALFFGPFWLLWHRHYLVGVLALVGEGLLFGALDALPVHASAVGAAHMLISLLFALEGASLRRFALARSGYAETGLVSGAGLDEMERRYFASLASEAPVVVAGTASVPQVRPAGVIGLFPQARHS